MQACRPQLVYQIGEHHGFAAAGRQLIQHPTLTTVEGADDLAEIVCLIAAQGWSSWHGAPVNAMCCLGACVRRWVDILVVSASWLCLSRYPRCRTFGVADFLMNS